MNTSNKKPLILKRSLLCSLALALGLSHFFRSTISKIYGLNGSEFVFKGIHGASSKTIKSFEAADICWIEEGDAISRPSLKRLTPTIRKPGSEIWISFNPEEPDDPIYEDFVANGPGQLPIKHLLKKEFKE